MIKIQTYANKLFECTCHVIRIDVYFKHLFAIRMRVEFLLLYLVVTSLHLYHIGNWAWLRAMIARLLLALARLSTIPLWVDSQGCISQWCNGTRYPRLCPWNNSNILGYFLQSYQFLNLQANKKVFWLAPSHQHFGNVNVFRFKSGFFRPRLNNSHEKAQSSRKITDFQHKFLYNSVEKFSENKRNRLKWEIVHGLRCNLWP